MLQIKLDQEQLARYGVPAKVVTDIIESIGSKPLGEVIEGQLRFPLVVRLPEAMRDGSSGIGSILIPTASGERLPLSRLADIRSRRRPVHDHARMGPAADHRLGQRPRPRHRQLRGRGPAADRRSNSSCRPAATSYEFGGQFEHLQRARTRLLIVVPLALVLIFALLYLTYHNVVDALRVFTGVPFGWVGGIFALWLRDMPFSISAGDRLHRPVGRGRARRHDPGVATSGNCGRRACRWTRPSRQAAITRLRPVLMTTLVASLGFLPMAFSTGMGAEVQRPLATVVIGGVISAMIMSLLGAARAVPAVRVAGANRAAESRSSKMAEQLVERWVQY